MNNLVNLKITILAENRNFNTEVSINEIEFCEYNNLFSYSEILEKLNLAIKTVKKFKMITFDIETRYYNRNYFSGNNSTNHINSFRILNDEYSKDSLKYSEKDKNFNSFNNWNNCKKTKINDILINCIEISNNTFLDLKDKLTKIAI